MLKSKTFIKKTKKGSIVKIVREHYLRDDITCGYEQCRICQQENFVLEKENSNQKKSLRIPKFHFLIPDTNVALHQIDILEDNTLCNFIILQTVLEEVRHRSAPIYKRLIDVISNPDRHVFTFINEFHKDTYVEREPGETSNDRNDRAIRVASAWYKSHLKQNEENYPEIVLLSNDVQNREKAIAMGITVFSIHDYINSLEGCPELQDRLTISESSKQSFSDKILYPEHLKLSVIQQGVKDGKYHQGSFSASRENYLEANVNIGGDDAEWVFIQGVKNINRAVDTDIVAIEILPESQWTCPSSMVLEDKNVDENDDIETKDQELRNKVPKANRLKSGRVVGIVKRKWRQYCGILQPSILKGAVNHLVLTAEKKIPKIRIQTRQVDSLLGQRLVVAIDSWPRNSRYPLGHFVRKLGAIGDKDTENEVLLLEHDIPHQQFSQKVLSFLPQMPWKITEEDYAKRMDLRDIPICSVDPPGCTDIDDALHCRALPNGNFEVGVHIADVSHFIRPCTALDEEAANRGTSVYLCDKRIDMVPELLSSNLCSLRDDGERFAFSVLWEMNEKADIINTKYTKSVIYSKASLTYAEAQLMIDEENRTDDLTLGLRRLNRFAKILKKKRLDNGALNLASTEVRFNVDSETADPIDVQVKKLMDTNSMVEEFMLLANISVAEKILKEFPDCACLRRHPAPPISNFEPLVNAAKIMGFDIDCSSGKALADSLNDAVLPENAFFNTMLRIVTTRCMMQAVYFASGTQAYEDYRHYGLACPIYTHFTSPIRRYSDIIVHRLLAVSINADASYPALLDKRLTQNVCNNLNYRHKMAQYAGRASVGLHTQLFFKNRVQDEQGYIVFVRKNAVQVIIPKYGLEAPLYLEKDESDVTFTYDEQTASQTSSYGDRLQIFDPVTVQVSIDRSNIQHQKLSMKLVKPEIKGFSVPPLADNKIEEPPAKKKKK